MTNTPLSKILRVCPRRPFMILLHGLQTPLPDFTHFNYKSTVCLRRPFMISSYDIQSLSQTILLSLKFWKN